MRAKHFRDVVLFVQHACHQGFLNSHKSALAHRGSRRHAPRLTGEASLAEELAGAQNGYDCFLASSGCDPEPHLASSKVEHRIRRVSLPEDVAVLAVFYGGVPAGDSTDEIFPIHRPSLLTHHSRPVSHHLLSSVESPAGT